MFTSVSVRGKGSAQVVVFGHFGVKGEGQTLDPKSKSLAAGLGIADALLSAVRRAEATGDLKTKAQRALNSLG